MKHSLTIAPSAAMQTFEYIEANKNNLHEWMPNGFCRWCHNGGGRYGTPYVVNEKNFVR